MGHVSHSKWPRNQPCFLKLQKEWDRKGGGQKGGRKGGCRRSGAGKVRQNSYHRCLGDFFIYLIKKPEQNKTLSNESTTTYSC